MSFLQNWVALGLFSAFFAALVAVLAKLGLQEVDATLATTLRSIVMVLVLLLASGLTGRFGLLRDVSGRAWLAIALSGLAGALSWVCYFIAIQVGNASRVSALDRLSIVVVVVLAGLFLGEGLGAVRLLGAGLIVAGAWLVAR
ncbi:MAG: EamA family transporter [Chloroflexota bacterium]|nr:EamA family transporter [Chloroflexota bacterium]